MKKNQGPSSGSIGTWLGSMPTQSAALAECSWDWVSQKRLLCCVTEAYAIL